MRLATCQCCTVKGLLSRVSLCGHAAEMLPVSPPAQLTVACSYEEAKPVSPEAKCTSMHRSRKVMGCEA